jgi:hypothetical protein
VTRFSSARQDDMISRKMVWTSWSFSGPGLLSATLAQHLRFALGAEHRRIGLGLHVADFLRHLAAAAQELEDLRVDRIDLFAQGL